MMMNLTIKLICVKLSRQRSLSCTLAQDDSHHTLVDRGVCSPGLQLSPWQRTWLSWELQILFPRNSSSPPLPQLLLAAYIITLSLSVWEEAPEILPKNDSTCCPFEVGKSR